MANLGSFSSKGGVVVEVVRVAVVVALLLPVVLKK